MRQQHGIAPLALSEDAALLLGKLPAFHRDPFDRMLICQATVEGLVLLTPDEQIASYPVRTLW
jgi:PIN domain nuclease of toxin-antitoxin system